MKFKIVASLCLCVSLSGCWMGLGLRGATLGVGESLTLGRAAVAGMRGGAAGAGRTTASRLLVSENLASAASGRSLLSEAFGEITAGGTRPATLALERDGFIRVGADRVLSYNASNGALVARDRVVGQLADGYIFEVTDGVRGAALAEARGFISGRNARFSTRASGTSHAAQRDLVVKVSDVEDGRILVRLADGTTEWLGPDQVTLFMTRALPADQGCSAGQGVLVLTTGESIGFDSCSGDNGAFLLKTGSGTVIVAAQEVEEIIPGAIASEVGATAVKLADGNTVYGLVERRGDTLWIHDENGGLIVADIEAVENQPATMLPS